MTVKGGIKGGQNCENSTKILCIIHLAFHVQINNISLTHLSYAGDVRMEKSSSFSLADEHQKTTAENMTVSGVVEGYLGSKNF